MKRCTERAIWAIQSNFISMNCHNVITIEATGEDSIKVYKVLLLLERVGFEILDIDENPWMGGYDERITDPEFW